jgi:alpha-1,3-glucan synthase
MDNSKGDLSIEIFLTRSEEKFFDKVRKYKLSSAASIRSSQHGCVWGSPSVHDCFPSCELLALQYKTRLLSNPSPAPSGFASIGHHGLNAFNTQGLLINCEPGTDRVIMARLQISLQREIAGWPLYTIILALGQVCSLANVSLTPLLMYSHFQRRWEQPASRSHCCLVGIGKTISSNTS